MEMNGEGSGPYLARTPLRPRVLYFVFEVGMETQGL